MSSALRQRVRRLEEKKGLGNDTLMVLVEPGETPDEAIERTCVAWGRPVETFSLAMVLNFHGEARAAQSPTEPSKR
jgi:hypothetical protein